MSVMNVNDDSFQDQVFTTDMLVLAEFSGAGSDSAQTGRMIDDLAEEFEDQVLMLRVDTDSSEATAENFAVDSVPTVIFFRSGSEVSRMTGLCDVDDYRQEVEKLLRD
ncbi:Thioredoxin [Pseudomonas cichorii]|uniref:Thioredoxin n=1 Tax=Pseudomonas cichorii TaxID=36746 RepID=A0A3M4M9S1_PSECI|nr:thioredoxin domain-containing protein [Pseudomonas cichorii]RMQ50572.1 Thioredoxin [Pseudomonas cichorii]